MSEPDVMSLNKANGSVIDKGAEEAALDSELETADREDKPSAMPLTATPKHRDSLGKQIIKGGIVITATRLVSQVLGVVSSLTIPRWLGPEEMGVFAVAMLTMGAIEAFTQSGFAQAFIQRKTDYEKYIRPVRTFNAVRGTALGLLIYFSAPFVAGWMESPRSVTILKVLALVPAISGLTPMIWTLASKRLMFGYAANFKIAMAIVELGVTIPLAWYLKSVWALVWGLLLTRVISVVVSTLLDREGRGFTLEWRPLRDLRGFGFWIFLSSIVSYLYVNGGNWAIGRLLDLQTLAVYTLAFKFCTMFTGEVARIVNEMMLPVFSHIQNDLPRLRTGFRKSFGILAMAVIGVGAFFCITARDYFSIVLGTKWASYTILFGQLLPWLSLWGICGAFAGAQAGVVQALGKPNWWLWTLVAMCLLMLVLVWPAVSLWGAVGVAAVLGGVAAFMQCCRYALLAHMLKIKFLEVVSHVIFPLIAGVVSVILALLARGQFVGHVWLQAIVGSITVTVAYIAIMLAVSDWMYPNPRELLQQVWMALRVRISRIWGRKTQ